MNDDLVSRSILLIGLALAGVSIGWVGTAMGIGGPVTDTDTDPTFVVSEHNVTFSDGSREVTVLENVTTTKTLEISERDGHLSVTTEEHDPLTDAERERALEIARRDETVTQYLDEMDEPELSVTPIKGIPRDSKSRLSVNVSDQRSGSDSDRTAATTSDGVSVDTSDGLSINASDGVVAVEESNGTIRTYRIETSVETGDDSVTITPADQTYAEDDVYVEIRDPTENEVKYKAQVNLPEERVVIVTDERGER